jgi:hypothetical protein
MSETTKLKEGYNKLKEIVKKLINPKKEKVILQPIPLQRPYRHTQRISRG